MKSFHSPDVLVSICSVLGGNVNTYDHINNQLEILKLFKLWDIICMMVFFFIYFSPVYVRTNQTETSDSEAKA